MYVTSEKIRALSPLEKKNGHPVILHFTDKKFGLDKFPLTLKERRIMYKLDLFGLTCLRLQLVKVWKPLDGIINPTKEEITRLITISEYMEDLDKRKDELTKRKESILSNQAASVGKIRQFAAKFIIPKP